MQNIISVLRLSSFYAEPFHKARHFCTHRRFWRESPSRDVLGQEVVAGNDTRHVPAHVQHHEVPKRQLQEHGVSHPQHGVFRHRHGAGVHVVREVDVHVELSFRQRGLVGARLAFLEQQVFLGAQKLAEIEDVRGLVGTFFEDITLDETLRMLQKHAQLITQN